MKATISISKSVGMKATNRSKDVAIIQNRLNQWIAAGQLPKVDPLSTDGKCGSKTKLAIGFFQARYVTFNPDCRADPGGKTVIALGLDYTKVNKPGGGVVVYNESPMPGLPPMDDEPAVWEKRGMFWFGGGAKVGGGIGVGADLGGAVLFNLDNHDNYFGLEVSTKRHLNIGAGASGGFQICFATGIYDPMSLNKIKSQGGDWAFAVGAKWLSFAAWAASLPKMGKLVSALALANYSDYKMVSELGTIIKAGIAGIDIRKDDTMPTFVAIDIPFLGGGTEVSVSYGVTSYRVLYKNLV